VHQWFGTAYQNPCNRTTVLKHLRLYWEHFILIFPTTGIAKRLWLLGLYGAIKMQITYLLTHFRSTRPKQRSTFWHNLECPQSRHNYVMTFHVRMIRLMSVYRTTKFTRAFLTYTHSVPGHYCKLACALPAYSTHALFSILHSFSVTCIAFNTLENITRRFLTRAFSQLIYYTQFTKIRPIVRAVFFLQYIYKPVS